MNEKLAKLNGLNADDFNKKDFNERLDYLQDLADSAYINAQYAEILAELALED